MEGRLNSLSQPLANLRFRQGPEPAGQRDVGVVVVTIVFAAASCTSIAEFKSLRAEPPLATINVTVDGGRPKDVFARVAPGVRIEKLIDLGIFDGFEPRMTLDAARSRLGSPTGEWNDPFCGKNIAFYDRPQGKVSLCRDPPSGQPAWATVEAWH